MNRPVAILFYILTLTFFAALVALPRELPIKFQVFGQHIDQIVPRPALEFSIIGRRISLEKPLKLGLDIQGGTQVVLQAQMDEILTEDREAAIESAREIIQRRVDLFGVSEPVVQTSQVGDEYRIIVELAGIKNPDQAINLIGTTARLDFRLQNEDKEIPPEATQSAAGFLTQFEKTDLSGQDLKKASVQFDPQTSEPVVSLEFNNQGAEKFAQITKDNVDGVLGIFLDDFPIMLPRINTPILNGQAVITGGFGLEEAKSLSIQLNAGALPVPIKVIQQRNIGASLGQKSVIESIRAGVIGILLVMVFMIIYYGLNGFLASLALIVYSILTLAIYKILGVTLTLPGIAGLLLSIGMAVDANILIFERMKEELRLGKPFELALNLGFGRAWDSIKDANLATIMTALILINPLDFGFLNSSGLVRGFGVTLLIGVVTGLFTGIVVTRTLMRVVYISILAKK